MSPSCYPCNSWFSYCDHSCWLSEAQAVPCFYSSTRFLLWFVLSSEVNYFRIMTPIFRSFPKGLSDEWSFFSSTGSINRSLSKIWLECLCGLQAKKGFCNVSCWKCGSQVVCAPAPYVWRGSPKKKSRSHCSYPLPELVYFRFFLTPRNTERKIILVVIGN